MKRFIDTSFFIALTDKDDVHHKEAQLSFANEMDNHSILFTTNIIIIETITRLRYCADFKHAKEFGDSFRKSERIDASWIDPSLEEDAWKLFLKYSDKDISYVDAISFAFMKREKISQALTFDNHFRQCGFEMLPA